MLRTLEAICSLAPLGYLAQSDLARFGPGVFSPGALPRRLERLDEPPNALVLAPLRRRDHGAAARGRRARASRARLIELVPDEPPHGNVTHRDPEHAEHQRAQHPADDPGADGVAGVGARAGR